MKRYDSYKDSGVQWIGEISSHWDIIPFRYMTTQLLTGLNPRDNFKLTTDDEFFYVTIKNFKDGILYLDENCDRINKQAWEIIQSRSDLQEGDILFASISRNGQAYIIREEPKNWNINESVFKIRPDFKKTISSYLYYCITNDGFFSEMFSESTGSTFKSIKQNKLKAMQLPLPPLAEQEMIVRHLDVKCGEIDKLIATQQRRIELLQELRQSIITRAVTRGINPDAPLRDSGIDWIGQIPTHWEIRKTSLIYNNIGSGTTPTSSNPDYYTENGDGFYWLQTGDLNDGDITSTSKQVTKLAVNECNLKFFPVDSVVIAMYGATIGKVGLLKIKTATNQACCVLPYSNRVVPKYSFFLYQAAKTPMLVEAIGGGQPNISQDIIKKLRVPLPPLSEQREIVAHIERETAKVDHALQQAERQIELLQELRQSVITEVVTGKRKVC